MAATCTTNSWAWSLGWWHRVSGKVGQGEATSATGQMENARWAPKNCAAWNGQAGTAGEGSCGAWRGKGSGVACTVGSCRRYGGSWLRRQSQRRSSGASWGVVPWPSSSGQQHGRPLAWSQAAAAASKRGVKVADGLPAQAGSFTSSWRPTCPWRRAWRRRACRRSWLPASWRERSAARRGQQRQVAFRAGRRCAALQQERC